MNNPAVSRICIIIAVVVFLLGFLLVLIGDDTDPEVITMLLFSGLAAFAAGHLNW